MSHAQAVELLEDAFLAAKVDELAVWTSVAHSPLQASVLETAETFAKEHRLAEWVNLQNTQHEVRVPTAMLIHHSTRIVEQGVAHGLTTTPTLHLVNL